MAKIEQKRGRGRPKLPEAEKKEPDAVRTFRVPADVWEGLSRRAETECRSVNGQLIYMLRKAFADEERKGGK